MGRGLKDVHAHLIGDLILFRLQGVLTSAEQHLVKSLPAEKGRDLLMKQVRTHLIETARPVLEAMLEEISGTKVMSLHQDISTATGEEILVFTLAKAPHLPRLQAAHPLHPQGDKGDPQAMTHPSGARPEVISIRRCPLGRHADSENVRNDPTTCSGR